MTLSQQLCAVSRRVAPALFTVAMVPVVSATEVVITETEILVRSELQSISANPVQSSMGAVIGVICPSGLIINNPDLQARCGEIAGAGVLNPDQAQNQQARDGMQAMAPEEDAVLGTSQVDARGAQMDAIGQRISNVRGGATTGVVQSRHNGFDWSSGAAGDTASTPWGFFVSGLYANSDRDSTDKESGFEADDYGVTAGVDYTFDGKVLIGAAFGYKDSEADIDSNGGNLDTDSYSFFGYWSLYPDEYWFVDGMVGYTDNNHDQQRNVIYTIGATSVNNAALSDTDSEEWSASLAAGRNFFLGSWVAAPMVRLEYADVSIDGFTESMRDSAASVAGSGLALNIQKQDFESVMVATGASFTTEWQSGFGSMYPEISFEYVHEFKNDNAPIRASFVNDTSNTTILLLTDAPDRNFFNIGAGLTASLADNAVAFFRYQGLLGYKHLDVHAFEFGIRATY